GPFAVFELHRIFQPTLAGDEFAHRSALGAVRAAIDRRVPTRLLADPDAIGDFGGDRAADRAVRADALADGRAGRERTGRGGVGLAHGGERQRADRGERAGGKPRAAQEGAAVDAGGRAGQRGRQPALPRGAFGFANEHGRLPLFLRVAVDAVEVLHVVGVGLVAGLALLRRCLGRLRLGDERRGGGHGETGAGAHGAQEVATAEFALVVLLHRGPPEFPNRFF